MTSNGTPSRSVPDDWIDVSLKISLTYFGEPPFDIDMNFTRGEQKTKNNNLRHLTFSTFNII